MKTLRKIWDALTMPFISIAVLIDESRRINEDGSWDEYHARKNRKAMKKQKRVNDDVSNR